VVRGPLLGHGAIFLSTSPLHIHPASYLLCVISGVVSALLALVATLLVYASEDGFRRLPLHWMWWPAVGGLVIGLGGLIEPRALGVGYDVIDAELTGRVALATVVGILVVKTLIWSLSLGSGTSGGVLAPMFMIGGALGTLEAQIFPSVGPGFWALVALAGVLGGVMRSPLTGVVFSVELTHQYAALLALVIAATTAYAVSVLILKRSVLTEKIARRGYHLSREYDVDPLEIVFVGEVMTIDVVELGHDLEAADAHAVLSDPAGDYAAWRQQLYPVVAPEGMVGVVTRGALFEAAAARPQAPVADLVLVDPVVTHADQTLRHVAELMAWNDVTTLPVLDRDGSGRVVGIVTLPQLLTGRARDQQEARERERVLRVRLVGRAERTEPKVR
jgi:CBS domain-containing protein